MSLHEWYRKNESIFEFNGNVISILIQSVQIAWFFFKNNYKTQTISLVRQRLKLIWFLTIRVQRTRFSSPRSPGNRVHWTRFLFMEIESNGLGFCTRKSSPLDSIFVHGNRAQGTRFSSFSTRTWNHQGRTREWNSHALFYSPQNRACE